MTRPLTGAKSDDPPNRSRGRLKARPISALKHQESRAIYPVRTNGENFVGSLLACNSRGEHSVSRPQHQLAAAVICPLNLFLHLPMVDLIGGAALRPREL